MAANVIADFKQETGAEYTPAPTVFLMGSSGNIGIAAMRMFLDKGYKIIAADWDEATNQKAIEKAGLLNEFKKGRIDTVVINAKDFENLRNIIELKNPDICVSTLPPGEMSFNAALASAVAGKNYTSSNFLSEQAIQALNEKTKNLGTSNIDNFEDFLESKEISSEWERGLDPGLDSWIFMQALEPFKGGSITAIKSVGAGVSGDPRDMYIYTWSGVTNGMGHRPAKIIINGEEKDIHPAEKFASFNRESIDHIRLEDGTILETYGNDDGAFKLLKLAENYGINIKQVQNAAVLTGRHQGHCELWDPLVRVLCILDDERIYDAPMSMNDLLISLIKEKYNQNPDFALEAGSPELQDVVDHVMCEGQPLHQLPIIPGSFNDLLKKNGFFSAEILNTGQNKITAKNMAENHLSNAYARREGKRDRSVIYVEISGTDAYGLPLSKKVELSSFGESSLNGHTSMQKTVAGTLVHATEQVLDGKIEPGIHGAAAFIEPGLDILEAMQNEGLITVAEKSVQAPQFQTTYDLKDLG